MAFDGEAVFIGSFNLDPRSAVINTEAGLYREPAACQKADGLHGDWRRAHQQLLETVRDGKRVRFQDEPETGFRRRFVADLLKLLPIDSQL
jgi:cardiolipin synthase C